MRGRLASVLMAAALIWGAPAGAGERSVVQHAKHSRIVIEQPSANNVRARVVQFGVANSVRILQGRAAAGHTPVDGLARPAAAARAGRYCDGLDPPSCPERMGADVDRAPRARLREQRPAPAPFEGGVLGGGAEPWLPATVSDDIPSPAPLWRLLDRQRPAPAVFFR